MAPVSTPHDALFKRTFSDPAHVRDELRAVLHPALLAQLNLASLRPCPGSFVDQALAGSHSDLLFSVELAGKPALLCVGAMRSRRSSATFRESPSCRPRRWCRRSS